MLQLAVSDVLPQAGAKQIDLGVAPDQPDQPALTSALVSGQLEALRTLLRNLLDNAVKYTPTGGQVDVSLHLRSGQPVLTVEDSGPGIAQADQARVFDRFFRAVETGQVGQAEQAGQTSGSGLGLAIVKVIAERHGATLSLARSARLGGLKVDVIFPPARPV